MKKLIFIFIFCFIFINKVNSCENNLDHYGKHSLKQMNLINKDKESVVCLHAFLRSYTSMKPIGRFLNHQNYEVFLWNYETRKFTLEEHADHLVRLLQKIALCKPGKAIHFVTHSIGGVIAKVALSHPDCPEEAKMGKAIFLAPPNAGSHLARKYRCLTAVQFVFGGKLGKQLLTYCPKKMLCTGSLPKSVDTLIISGYKPSRFIPFKMKCPNDGKVAVIETKLPGVNNNISLNVSHTYIIVNPECFKHIKEFLENKPTNTDLTKNTKNKLNISTKNAKQSTNTFVIHCFASHPYQFTGFP